MSAGYTAGPRAAEAVKSMPSIRIRLLMLAALAVAPLMIDRIRLLEADRREHVAAAFEQAMTLARQAQQAQQDIVTGAHAVLQIVARALPPLRSIETCDEAFPRTPIDV